MSVEVADSKINKHLSFVRTCNGYLMRGPTIVVRLMQKMHDL